MKTVVLLLLAVIHVTSAQSPKNVFTLATDFATGVQQAQREGKPIMAIILRSYCGSCKNLLNDIAANRANVQKAANGVVVVQSIDDSEPAIEEYGYDKYRSNPYWPRIVFISASTTRPLNVVSPYRDWPSYYSSARDVIAAINRAIEQTRGRY